MPRTSPAPRIQLTVASPAREVDERTSTRGPSLPWLAAATLGALASMVLGWVVVGAAVVIGWVSAPTILPATAFEAIGQAWLGVHLVPHELAGMKINLLPLGLTGLVALAMAAVAGYAYSQVDADQRRRPWTTSALVAGVCTLTYALAAMMVATVVGTNDQVVACLRGAITVAGLGSVLGVVQVSRPRIPRAPAWIGALPGAAGSGLVTLIGMSLVALIVAVISHASAVAGNARELSPDLAGGILLTLIHLIYLPNLLAWAGSYLVGSGFYAASDLLLTPTQGGTGLLPMLPVTGALPLVPPVAGRALWASGVLAGAVAGAYLVRRTPSLHRAGTASNAARGLVAGALAAACWCALAWFAHGSLGTGRLALVGPRFPEILLYAGVEMTLGGALGAAMASWFALRHNRAVEAEQAADRAKARERAAARAAKRAAVIASLREQTSRPLHPAVEARLRAAGAHRNATVVAGAIASKKGAVTKTTAEKGGVSKTTAEKGGVSKSAAENPERTVRLANGAYGPAPFGLGDADPLVSPTPFGLEAERESRVPFSLDAEPEPFGLGAQPEPFGLDAQPADEMPFGLDPAVAAPGADKNADAPFGLG